jgi:hypothetical protein
MNYKLPGTLVNPPTVRNVQFAHVDCHQRTSGHANVNVVHWPYSQAFILFSVTSEQHNTDMYIIHELIGTAVMYSRNVKFYCNSSVLCFHKIMLLNPAIFTTSGRNMSSLGRHWPSFSSLQVSYSWLPYDFSPKARSLNTSRQTAELLRQGKLGRHANTFYHSIYSTCLIYIILLWDF